MERQLFCTEQHNRYLKDNLQQVKELMEKKDEEIASLQQQLDLSKSLNQTGEIQEELNGVDEQPRKVDIGLQINIPLRDISDSQELLNSEGNLEEEVGRPREVLQEREEQFRERSLRPEADVDTLALLTQTEAALRENNQAINQLYDLCDHWENIINHMMETERKVQEETKVQKLEESRLQQEIQHLHVEKVQLQTVHAETELMGRPRERPRDFEKPRSPENDLVPKERADWKKQLQELQEKCGKMERQLFYTEQHNRYLKDNLQQVKELMEKKDEEIASLQQQLDLSKSLNQTGEIQEELNGVDEQPRKVDIGLQINIPLRDISDSQELLNSEGNLEEEVGRPREVLQEREEQFRERSLRPEAHVDTLALLTQTEAALRENNQAINQLYDLCDHWENIINQMMETERKVQEETKVQKLEESRLQQEIQHLHVEKVQLQVADSPQDPTLFI
ncbi:hypothetical protein D4764_08G0009170 [Takifugu flavidus]|uniref:Uncharacterized protein n=1 Tax=Takifugu flavidus TaxID=433684 RepID=A0A5C6MTY0_9TELE|nr:hypothetical protein D4764_08G0009170 [Takifugu flavidus]